MAKCKNCKKLYYAEVVFKHGTSTIPCCFADGEEIEDIGEERECFDFECMTNADRIRSMSDEELAEFLRTTIAETGDNLFRCDEYDKTEHCIGHMCTECGAYLAWLKSELGWSK